MQLVAVVPHPPLLVPELAAGRASELAPVLAACDAAVSELVAAAPSVVVCLGAGTLTTRHLRNAWGTFAGFGADVSTRPVPGVEPATVPRLGLPLTVGRWLLERVGWSGEVVCQEIALDAGVQACRAVGRRLHAEVEAQFGRRSAWLVLSDADSAEAVQVQAGAQQAGGGDARPERVRLDVTPYGVRYRVAGWWLVE